MAKKQSLEGRIKGVKSLLTVWGFELHDTRRDIQKQLAVVGPLNQKLYQTYERRDSLIERLKQGEELLKQLQKEQETGTGG